MTPLQSGGREMWRGIPGFEDAYSPREAFEDLHR